MASLASAGVMLGFTWALAWGAGALAGAETVGWGLPPSWVALITFSMDLSMASGQEVTGTPG